MEHSPAQNLTDALYSLRELEVFQPHKKFHSEQALVELLKKSARELKASEFQSFVRELIQATSLYCQDPTRNQETLYRAFDGIDELLEIDYAETSAMMPKAEATERLYEGGGLRVQTSYSTILKVLEHLQPAENAHLIDLGSGFGRVGLTAGLWRSDLRFSGYEFVGHRVNSANASAKLAGLTARVQFLQQDLSALSFEIPTADAYYLYDPFSVATYLRVLNRLTEISRGRKITVIAKDAARETFLRGTDRKDWEPALALDEGSIAVYRSR